MITNIPHSSELESFQQFDSELSTLTPLQISKINEISKSYNFLRFICTPNKKIVDDNLSINDCASVLYYGIDKLLYSVDIDINGNTIVEKTDFEIEPDQLKIEIMKLYQLATMDQIEEEEVEEETQIILSI